MNNIIIEKLDNKDVEQVVSLEQSLFHSPWTKEQFLYELNDNPFAKIFVVKIGDEVIGYIDYMITFNSATISKIAIKSEYQKNGLGSKLMEYMMDDLNSLGYGEIETITLEVRISNIKAISLYKKFGFKEVNVKKNYYIDKEDALYMLKVML